MSYNPSIPQPTDNLSTSQGQMLNNFFQLNAQYAVDHVAFNTGSGNGDGSHKKITFDNAAPEPSPTGTISNIFPLLVGSNQELFFKNASTDYNGTGKTQITGPSTLSANGNAQLPGGLVIQWGLSGNINSQTNFTRTFPSAAYAVVATSINPAYDGSILVTSLNTAGFTARRSDGHTGSTGFYYIALGK